MRRWRRLVAGYGAAVTLAMHQLGTVEGRAPVTPPAMVRAWRDEERSRGGFDEREMVGERIVLTVPMEFGDVRVRPDHRPDRVDGPASRSHLN